MSCDCKVPKTGKELVDFVRSKGKENTTPKAKLEIKCVNCNETFVMNTCVDKCPHCNMTYGVTPCSSDNVDNVKEASINY